TNGRGIWSRNQDVNSAAPVAQRSVTIIYGFYTPGVGHLHRNFWEATNGQNDMARLSELSGGESYFLGLRAPVSFKPYFEDVQRNLDNQYCWNLTRDLATEQAYNPSR